MTLRDVMSSRVITISADTTVGTAREILAANRIQHLVVVDGKRVAGSVWDRDLVEVTDDTRVTEVMDRRIVTIDSGATIRAVAGKLSGRDAGAVLVLDGERLIGIITASDLVRALAKGTTHLSPQEERMILRQRGGSRRRPLPVR